MKVVAVEFVHITRLENGKPARTSSTVICEDDVDKYDIHQEFEGAFDFGWVISSVKVVKEGLKIVRADSTY
ncbi:hypothetical protein ISREJYDI_CDS0162 [Pseudomonas phage UNO-G1W1]|jgi:hypothetical protein|uniref:Uncharacterized protein n=1 Tax=Pseudomonas phage UNO-G1W1 TaxID=3136609 RepID=A0AAX4MW02_9CAUD